MKMSEERMRNRDLVLPPRTQAFVLDTTKGKISAYVGPSKTSMSETDQLVVWDSKKRSFVPTNDVSKAVMNWAEAGEGQYIVLLDPAKDGKAPAPGTSPEAIELCVGSKVIIPGPCTFPLWPGQTAETIDGHRMATNQYVVVRVSSPEEAMRNWKNDRVSDTTDNKAPDLEMGELIIIKGTDVSFYIPSTGLEVVPDDKGNFVQDAVTLEQLEYSILINEDGTKRYVRGPAVVFPTPTEKFVSQNDQLKFQAIELSPQSGIYAKVTAPYEEDGKEYKVGDELFITGNEAAFYFPRAEHNLIKYGDRLRHHAIAIPEGEGRYVLDRNKGTISLVKGPKMYLPNPINEVIVKRVLDPETVRIMYPGNKEAIEINEEYTKEIAEQTKKNIKRATSDRHLLPERTLGSGGDMMYLASTSTASPTFKASSASTGTGNIDTSVKLDATVFGDKATTRGTSFSEPRTITLNTKYDGAVTVNVWPGYAVMVIDKLGNRRVEMGPKSILLEYNESLMVLELSTGKPKNTDKLYKTCYLRTINNAISDIISVETSDLVPLSVKVSYRVNFEGDTDEARAKWFDVENYVKFLTDHCRSRLRDAAKRATIQEFYANAPSIIRATLLGAKPTDGERKGLLFKENNMRLYDVEILQVTINNENVARLLGQATYDALQGVVEVSREKEKATQVGIIEGLKRQNIKEEQLTLETKAEAVLKELTRKHELELAVLENKLSATEEANKIAEKSRELERLNAEQELAIRKADDDQYLARLVKETELRIKGIEAISGNMIIALDNFGDKNFVDGLNKALAPAALASGMTTAELFSQIFKDTPFEGALEALGKRTLTPKKATKE